ncbi:hypothetical protein ACJJTC_005190 [Scirpophaga incertulas]
MSDIEQVTRIRQLISGEELGDRKPSQFLRHLRSLAGNLSDDHILRELFMQRLPRSAQQILAAHADMKLEKVAELADSILEVNSSSVNSIQNSPQIAELTAQVLELTRQVAALSSSHQKSGFRSRSTLRSRSKSRSHSPDRVIGRPVPLPSRAVSEPIVPPAAPAGSTIPPAAPSTLLAPNIQTAKIPVQQPNCARSLYCSKPSFKGSN